MRDNSILFVAGDEDVQRHVYDTYEFGYWSAGFDAILEKNGFLDVETATQDVLADPETLRRYDVVLVAWLPPTFWEMAYLRALWGYDGLVFLEGPFPGFLEDLLGVEGADGANFLGGDVEIVDEGLRATVSEVLGDFASVDMLELQPKTELTEYFEIPDQRWDGDAIDSTAYEFEEIAPEIAKSYAVAYGKREEEENEFFEHEEYDTLTSVFLAQFLSQVEDKERLRQSELEEIADRYHQDGLLDSDALDTVEQIRGVEIANEKYLSGGQAEGQTSLTSHAIGGRLFDAWVGSQIYRQKPNDRLKESIIELVTDVSGVERNGFSLSDLQNTDSNELAAVAAILANVGETEVSRKILEELLEQTFDWEKGLFKTFKITDGEREDLGTYSNIPWIPLAFINHVTSPLYNERVSVELQNSYDSDWIEAFQSPPYTVSKYQTNGCATAAEIEEGGEQWPLVFERGNVIGASFQIFGYIAHFHSMHPLSKPLYSVDTQPVMNVEILLFQYLRQNFNERQVDFLTVSNWPWNKDYCFTLRHDVDRIPESDQFDELVEMQERNNLGVSWFWLPFRTDTERLDRLVELDHEIGIHTIKLEEKKEEKSRVELAISSPYDIVGEAVHGGGGSNGWLGLPTIETAIDAGLEYADYPGSTFTLPYGFLRMNEDKTITKTPLTILTPSFTIDSGAFRTPHLLKKKDEWVDFHVRNGSYVSILNHPDINFDLLEEVVESLPEEGRLDWTYAEVADWWNRTHRRDALTVERVTDTSEETVYRLTAEEDVEDLEVRLPRGDDYRGDVELTADGETITPEYEEFTDETTGQKFVRVRVDLEAGEPVELQYRTESLPAYEDIPPQIPDDITGPRAEADYLLPRVSKMTQVLANFADVSDLTGKSVLDAGCGYGPFTMALYLSDRPARAVGADISEKYVRTGNQLCAETGMHDVEFVQSAFRELTDVLDERFDVLIVNNSINFLTSRKAYTEAIREFYEILEPGGAMIILTPNRYHLEEAFTGLKGVQFLPDRIADWYVRKKGIRDGYDDIRLPSSFELVWWLRRTGFEDVQVVDAYQFTTEGWRRHFKPRFYVTARKPE